MDNKQVLNCMVLDDEFPAVNLLADYVNKTPGLNLILKTVDALEAIKAVQNGDIDLLFLDIQMPKLTGFELMRIIQSFKTSVILTTAYSAYALDGYEFDVIDYLLKPITYDRFLIAVNKAKERIRLKPSGITADQPDFIFVKTEYRLQKILFSSIFYIEGLRDYIAFHTSEGKFLSLELMKNMQEILPGNTFLRIHKSYIINIKKIDYVERGRIVIHKEYLPVGETYKSVVKEKLNF
jgi:two-component system LytT family response regulator